MNEPQPRSPSSSIARLGGHLVAGVSKAFAKFQSAPPLITLPAVALASWLATPYAVQLVEHGPFASGLPAEAGTAGTDGTTTVGRTEEPGGSALPIGKTFGAAPSKPWTDIFVPVTPAAPPMGAPLQQALEATAPRVPAAPPRAKVIARIAPVVQGYAPRYGMPARPQTRVPFISQAWRGALQAGRSAFGGGYPQQRFQGGGFQPRMAGFGAHGSFGFQPRFGGYRGFGGGFRGGRR